MINPAKHNILDGVTLKSTLEELGKRIDIPYFTTAPSIETIDRI